MERIDEKYNGPHWQLLHDLPWCAADEIGLGQIWELVELLFHEENLHDDSPDDRKLDAVRRALVNPIESYRLAKEVFRFNNISIETLWNDCQGHLATIEVSNPKGTMILAREHAVGSTLAMSLVAALAKVSASLKHAQKSVRPSQFGAALSS